MLLSAVDFLKPENNLSFPHKGIVVDNIDDLMLGRVKVTVAGVFEETDSTKLPWVYPINPTGLGGSDITSSFAVPEIGTELTIVFPFKDVYMPFYSGYWQSASTHQAYFNDDYPESYGFMDSMGNKYKVNKLSGDTEIEHQSGTKVTIDGDGVVVIESPKEITVEAPTVNIGAKATAVNLGAAGNLCNNYVVCSLTGAPHSPGNTTVKC